MIIEELACKNCGGHELEAKGTNLVCAYCKSVFLLKGTAFDYAPTRIFVSSSINIPPWDEPVNLFEENK
jgi:DNA-directed RNA polymerase subunit RPC12/RpoP